MKKIKYECNCKNKVEVLVKSKQFIPTVWCPYCQFQMMPKMKGKE